MFTRCYDRDGFSVSKLLNLNYNGIRIGDLVSSTTLRLNPEVGGSIRRGKIALLGMIIEAMGISDYVRENFKKLNSDEYMALRAF